MRPLRLHHPETVAIGVTGHRTLQNADQFLVHVDQVLDDIQVAHPGCSVMILSPLAEGADRLVTTRVLAKEGTNLIAVMPMRIDRYLSDFETPGSRREFQNLLDQAAEVVELSEGADRAAAYAAAGSYILERCDLLIALWDGHPSKGVGGTAEIVAQARERGIPLAWIRAVRSKAEESGERSSVPPKPLHYENLS